MPTEQGKRELDRDERVAMEQPANSSYEFFCV